MAINRVLQLDGVELLPNEKYRIRLSRFYVDSVSREEEPAREPIFKTLNPALPAHQPAILALKSAWDAVYAAASADR